MSTTQLQRNQLLILIGRIQLQIQTSPAKASTKAYQQATLLIQELHSHIPQIALSERPEVTQDNYNARQTQRPYAFVCTFYGIQDPFPTSPADGHFNVPQLSIFENLVSCSTKCAQELGKVKDAVILREVFGGTLSLLNGMVNRLSTPIEVAWDPMLWFNTLLESMEHEVRLSRSQTHRRSVLT